MVQSVCRFQLGSFHGQSEGFRLQIEDDASGLLVLETTFTYEQLARLIGNQNVLAEAQVYGNERVGHKMETQRVYVDPDGLDSRANFSVKLKEAVDDYMRTHRLSPKEWKPDIESSFNGHRLKRGRGYPDGGGYEVILRRWIAPTEGDDHAGS